MWNVNMKRIQVPSSKLQAYELERTSCYMFEIFSSFYRFVFVIFTQSSRSFDFASYICAINIKPYMCCDINLNACLCFWKFIRFGNRYAISMYSGLSLFEFNGVAGVCHLCFCSSSWIGTVRESMKDRFLSPVYFWIR